jgi:predicted transcriptional regulator
MFPDSRVVRIRRRQLGLTQSALAREAGVSQSLIAKLESEKIEPSYSNMKKVFSALNRLEQTTSVKASELMTKKIFSVTENDSIKKAVSLMASKKVSQLPVFKGPTSIGAITEKAISQKTAEGANLKGLKVKDLMEEALPVVSFDTPVKPIASLLNYSPAVLVAKKGKIIGIISKSDLLKII